MQIAGSTAWADGIYSGLRAEQTKFGALVVIGVNERGEKRFLAIEDGVRESTTELAEVLLKLKSRVGYECSEFGIGDGCDGVLGRTGGNLLLDRQQRCWTFRHKRHERPQVACPSCPGEAETGPALDGRPRRFRRRAQGTRLFIETYEPKYPKAALCLQKDRRNCWPFMTFRPSVQVTRAFRTTNPIESTVCHH